MQVFHVSATVGQSEEISLSMPLKRVARANFKPLQEKDSEKFAYKMSKITLPTSAVINFRNTRII